MQQVLEADTKLALAYFACFPTGTPGVALPAIDNTYYSVYVAILQHYRRVACSVILMPCVYACIPSTYIVCHYTRVTTHGSMSRNM